MLTINGIDGSTATQLSSTESTTTSSIATASTTAIARLTAGEGVRFSVYNSGASPISLGVGDQMTFSILYDGPA